jgi:hypothetical protein
MPVHYTSGSHNHYVHMQHCQKDNRFVIIYTPPDHQAAQKQLNKTSTEKSHTIVLRPAIVYGLHLHPFWHTLIMHFQRRSGAPRPVGVEKETLLISRSNSRSVQHSPRNPRFHGAVRCVLLWSAAFPSERERTTGRNGSCWTTGHLSAVRAMHAHPSNNVRSTATQPAGRRPARVHARHGRMHDRPGRAVPEDLSRASFVCVVAVFIADQHRWWPVGGCDPSNAARTRRPNRFDLGPYDARLFEGDRGTRPGAARARLYKPTPFA